MDIIEKQLRDEFNTLRSLWLKHVVNMIWMGVLLSNINSQMYSVQHLILKFSKTIAYKWSNASIPDIYVRYTNNYYLLLNRNDKPNTTLAHILLCKYTFSTTICTWIRSNVNNATIQWIKAHSYHQTKKEDIVNKNPHQFQYWKYQSINFDKCDLPS